MRFFGDLRRKYGCDHLWVLFPFRRTLLVLDPKSMDAVLHSDENFADPFLKKRALSRFAPDALIISSGDEWSDRRRFNESALRLRAPHPHSDAFKAIVFEEIDLLTGRRPRELRWTDFEALGERISQQIILGAGQLEPEMAAQLARLVGRGNWLLPRRRHDFAAFYDRIDGLLAQHRAFQRSLQAGQERGQQPGGKTMTSRCLIHEGAERLETRSTTASTRVPSQIGFWLFVLKDAVELHVARTLALIAAHPQVQERVRQEIRKAPLSSAAAVDGLKYLEACLAEQLRLWTPVPILLRRAVKRFSLRGEIAIEKGRQILIHTGSYHRDARFFGGIADSFSPDSIPGASPSVYFFSRDRQSCAGETLARFVLKATLARLLEKFRFELIAPAITPGRIPYLYDHFKIQLRPLSDG